MRALLSSVMILKDLLVHLNYTFGYGADHDKKKFQTQAGESKFIYRVAGSAIEKR